MIYWLSLMIGIFLAEIFHQLPSFWFCLSGILVFILFFLKFKNTPTFIGVCFFLGMLIAAQKNDSLQAWHLPTDSIAKNLEVVGTVDSIPKTTQLSTQFVFKTDLIAQKKQNTLLSLSLYHPTQVIQLGETWHFLVRLKPAYGLYNPTGFNYQQWLYVAGIRATGYVSGQAICLHEPSAWSLSAIRSQVLQDIHAAIQDPALRGVITALTLGTKVDLDQKTQLVFQNTGTSHLIVISGLHIGLIAGVFYWLGFQIARFSTRLSNCIAAPRIASVIGLLAATLYSFLAGFEVPTQRAFIMILALMLLDFFEIYWPLWLRLFFAFCCVMSTQPLSIFSASFWLSFMAVASIACIFYRKNKNPAWISWLKLQVSLFLALLPLTILYFEKLALSMMVANLIAVPWVSFLVVPVCFIAIITHFFSKTCAVFIFKMASFSVQPVYLYLNYLHHLPYLVWYHSVTKISLVFLAYFGLMIFYWQKKMKYRLGGLLLFLPLLLWHPAAIPKNTVQLTVLDVGQGLASVLQTSRHILIYDTGPKSFSGFDAGESVVVPYLRYYQLKKIDAMIISHGDNDHSGGAKSILSVFPSSSVLSSLPSIVAPLMAKRCYAGQHWRWDGVNFAILWPPKNQAYLGNNSSCVLEVDNGASKIIFTGDIQAPVEKQLIDQSHLNPVTVLIAPHHGSKTSSTLEFVRILHPKLVIFSTGFYNKFHFPAESVVERYTQIKSIQLNTAFTGAVTVKLDTLGHLTWRVCNTHSFYWQQ